VDRLTNQVFGQMGKREIIEPLALAARGRSLEGRLPLASLSRLLPLLALDESQSASGEVEYELEFGRDEGRTPQVRGIIKATLPLVCQRCMGVMDYPVATRTRLGIVSTRAAAEKLPSTHEPLLLPEEDSEDELTLAGLVEDELILALPQVAMHNSKECPQGDAFRSAEGQENAIAPRRENPFAMLSQLKTSQSNKDD
jgi:DUF177 domain-containing protein